VQPKISLPHLHFLLPPIAFCKTVASLSKISSFSSRIGLQIGLYYYKTEIPSLSPVLPRGFPIKFFCDPVSPPFETSSSEISLLLHVITRATPIINAHRVGVNHFTPMNFLPATPVKCNKLRPT